MTNLEMIEQQANELSALTAQLLADNHALAGQIEMLRENIEQQQTSPWIAAAGVLLQSFLNELEYVSTRESALHVWETVADALALLESQIIREGMQLRFRLDDALRSLGPDHPITIAVRAKVEQNLQEQGGIQASAFDLGIIMSARGFFAEPGHA